MHGVVQREANLRVEVRRHRGRGGDDVLHDPGVAPLHREMQRGDRLGRVVELHAPHAAVRVDDELPRGVRVGA